MLLKEAGILETNPDSFSRKLHDYLAEKMLYIKKPVTSRNGLS